MARGLGIVLSSALTLAVAQGLQAQEAPKTSTLVDQIDAVLAERGCTQEDVDRNKENLSAENVSDLLAAYRGEVDHIASIPSDTPKQDGDRLRAAVEFARCLLITDALQAEASAGLITLVSGIEGESNTKTQLLEYANGLADGIKHPEAAELAGEGDAAGSKAAIEAARDNIHGIIKTEQAEVISAATGLPQFE